MATFWHPFQRLSALDFVVALYNVATCDEADCDPEYTQKKLIISIMKYKGAVTKPSLERVLFCLNMNDEAGKFWHPLNYSFDKFLKQAVPQGWKFDKYYNTLERVK